MKRTTFVRHITRVLAVTAILALAASLVLGTGSAVAEPPLGYYDSIDDSDATVLRQSLHEIIDDHTRFPYTSSATDTWNILELADEDPNDSSRILDVYRNASYAKEGGGNSYYNREHTWPKSYGFPIDGSDNYPYTDCHQLYSSNSSYNSARSNKPYDSCDGSCSEYTTLVNNGVGGGSGVYPGSSNWSSSDAWEVWDNRRGDIARAMFYMDVRYEGGIHGVSGASEPDLILTDDRSLITSDGSSNRDVAYMGILSVLIQWHLDDPVDDRERQRNDEVAAFQGNRNPFVDHPEWADCIFAGSCGGGGGGGGGGGAVFINEFHYDNASTDTGEFIEIAGPSGTDLSGWEIIGYNGFNGFMYKTVELSGTIPDHGGCMGTLEFEFTGLQNGGPDGFALIDPDGAVVELSSYEGSFTALDGPASGMTTTDVGVSESFTTPIGHSLQRVGTGSAPGDFTWVGPSEASNGAVNAGQTFADACGPAEEPWINEIHYDNDGADTDEIVEIAGRAGTDLSGWELVGYNGASGVAYRVVGLSGAIPNEDGSYGALAFSFVGLQNGGPDGLALVAPDGSVVQFLSYEGSLTALDGPAAGLLSTDIGVSEPFYTPIGNSLQLIENRCTGFAARWAGPSLASPGSLNQRQQLSCE